MCKPSSQIDLIIYSVTYPFVFRQDDFIITTPDAVMGIIEVKKRLHSGNLKETIQKSTENGTFLEPGIFNGIFAFDSQVDAESSALQEHLENSKGNVNHICFGDRFFVKYWENTPKKYSIYDIPDYSYAYFISNLLEMVTPHDLDARYGLLYPIEGGKESKKLKDIVLNQ